MIDVEQLKESCFDVIGAIQTVHDEMGPGLNEYVYQQALAIALKEEGIPFQKELTFRPSFHGIELEAEYRLDFLCKDDIIIECKSISSKLGKEQRAQLFNYLRLCKAPIGILVNFQPTYAEIERYFYDDEAREIISTNGNPVSSKN